MNVIFPTSYVSRSGREGAVCIAGGAGFLGSHLADRLIERGYGVVCLDNMYTGRLENIAHLIEHPNFTFHQHDISTPLPDDLPTFDRIYNLACPASPIHYQKNPIYTAVTCAWGTMHLLERTERDRGRLLQASTSEIYGDPEQHPQRENYVGHVNPVGPRSCYDEGKRFAETLCTDYGVPVRIARIFNTYGPRMREDDGRVVSNFIVQALAGRDITINGDGTQTRSFCYVDDLIEGLIALMEFEGRPGPVNLGNPFEIPVSELASIIVAMVGSRSRIIYRAPLVDDPVRRRPDITKATELLHWAPQTNLLSGLEKTVAYFQERLTAGDLVPA